jgi:hypothetical protein
LAAAAALSRTLSSSSTSTDASATLSQREFQQEQTRAYATSLLGRMDDMDDMDVDSRHTVKRKKTDSNHVDRIESEPSYGPYLGSDDEAL